MSYLPQSNFGNCSVCPSTQVPCVKKGKVLICIPCNNRAKAEEQIKKSTRRNAARNTGNKLRTMAGVNLDMRAKKDYGELDRWFKERQKEMTGRCQNCSGKTEAYTKHFKCSIGHILPKAYFPSVATHPSNWLELCFYGKSCHTNMDNKMLDLTEMSCWDEIVTKFCVMYPSIDKKEQRRIPEVLLQYIEVEK